MTGLYDIPQDLLGIIGSETTDFIVKSRRAQPLKVSLFLILFASFWLLFTAIFMIAFLGPLFSGNEVEFIANGTPVVASPRDLGPILVPALVIGLFLLVGIGILTAGLVALFKKGGYIVGTPTRLISFRSNGYRSVDWEQFSGDIEVKGNEQRGSITLGMRTGRMVSSKNSSDRYVPDTFYISGITGVADVEKICRRRIKENDPTPARF